MDTEYLKRVGLYIASAIVSLGIIIYFGYHIWSSFTPDVKTEPIVQSTIVKTADCDAYIFREETVLTANNSGTLVASVAEGEKVGIGAEAVKIYSSGAADTVNQINDIDAQLELLLECTDTSTVTLKDAARFDEEIYGTMTDIRLSLDGGKTDIVSALKSSLITSASKKAILMGSEIDIQDEIASLQGERAELVSSLGSCLETIYSPKSGYYYSAVDGYESAFDATALAAIDFDTLASITNDTAPTYPSNASGKLVTSSTWYVVCYVEKGVGSLMKEGETRNITFSYNSDLTIEMTLERLIRNGDTYACVFSTSYMPEGFEYTRCQSVKIAMAEYTGFKVRVSSVRVMGDTQGVYVLDGGVVNFRKISVITEYEGYYIVETNPAGSSEEEETDENGETTEIPPDEYRWLKLHDNIITEGTGLYHGRILGK